MASDAEALQPNAKDGAGGAAREASDQGAQPPRPGSKQALVIGMLSAKSGATLGALVDATGWLPHTTRAALTGLRKRGFSGAVEGGWRSVGLPHRCRDDGGLIMAPRARRGRPAAKPVAPEQPTSACDIEQAIARIGAMHVGALRFEWRLAFGSEPPPAFSKDLLARAICCRLQEQVHGGLSPTTARLLRSLSKPGVEPPRQVKAGSVIVREHKGVLHEVMVTPGGFCWRGETYASLSTIARKITGVSWNGPRFFGLRSKQRAEGPGESSDADRKPVTDAPEATSASANHVRGKRRPGRRSSLRPPVHASGDRP